MNNIKNVIEIYAGKTHNIVINPIINGEIYKLKEDDAVIFTLKVCADSRYPSFLKKRLTVNDYVNDKLYMNLMAEETKDLSAGSYMYDCCLEKDGNSYLFIKPTVLFIKSGVGEVLQ